MSLLIDPSHRFLLFPVMKPLSLTGNPLSQGNSRFGHPLCQICRISFMIPSWPDPGIPASPQRSLGYISQSLQRAPLSSVFKTTVLGSSCVFLGSRGCLCRASSKPFTLAHPPFHSVHKGLVLISAPLPRWSDGPWNPSRKCRRP